jgi:hypothetical protein
MTTTTATTTTTTTTSTSTTSNTTTVNSSSTEDSFSYGDPNADSGADSKEASDDWDLEFSSTDDEEAMSLDMLEEELAKALMSQEITKAFVRLFFTLFLYS